MNRFDRGIERLKKRLSVDAKVIVTYHRGLDSVLLPNVWFGRQMFRIEDEGFSRIEWSDRDFMIPVESLILANVLVQPQRGDWIQVTMPNPYGVQMFEIAAPENERPWRFCDQQGRLYRVHTKRVNF